MQTISVTEAYDLAQTGVPIIDVREPNEFAANRLDGAVNVPLSLLQQAGVSALPPAKAYIIHCLRGRRSETACPLLAPLTGEAILYNVAGGLEAWVVAGLPVQNG